MRLMPVTVLPTDSAERVVQRFEAPGVSNYTALLLSPDGRTLYLGARELLLALNTSHFQPGAPARRLLWSADEEKKRQCVFKGKDPQRDCHNYIKLLLRLNSTHLYTCGTCAFSPACTYINMQHFSLERDVSGKVLLEDGKGRCPFDPEYRSTAVMVDGELYAGTVSNFQGNEPTISRSQENRIALKTENSLNWLQDPVFVGSAYLRESLPAGNPEGDDDKVYFFFSETGKEFDYFENTIVSRIARVCKGDQGGERVLQRRWTTFLKAQLLCSHPEDGFPFNVLQDIFVLTPGELRWRDTLFYGVFTSQWNKGGLGSAVCAFPMRSVQRAFGGLYKEVNRETQQWYTDTGPVPEPRPGTVGAPLAPAQALWAQDIEDADTERLCQLANASQPRPRILLPPASGAPCQRIQLPPNAVRPLPCRLLSNLASRRWLHDGAPVNASYLVLPDGALILVGSPERTGTYECWSLEEGFHKLMASYCVSVQELGRGPLDPGRKVASGHDALETVSTSRSTSAVGSAAARLDGKTYWTEFLVMCVLFAAAVFVLALFVLHRHRDGMKALLEPGDPSRHQKPPRKPVESLPLNGSSLPSAASEHKGYQALQDNYIVSTPVHEPSGTPRTFSESEKRPLHIRDSFVEVSPACQRPRVRLGSEIQDSVV
ncbi:semaphorin-4B [Manacus vitellinus]|uniref:semaphorin-4B n=1 Tax=Manacus vitellinus TaxID=328815 RepID=UPI00115E59E5|nr:semaphorin-4B [Manacus vitellinus]